jgi:hypothetical protein
LKADRLKIDEAIMTRPHEILEAVEHGFTADQFLNINSPADLNQAERWYADAQAKAARQK